MTVQNKKGFTLIELLVVIAIIGFLTTLAVVSLKNIRSKARDDRRMSDIQQISKAIALYYDDNKTFPTATGCLTGAWSSWGCWPNLIPKTYIQSMPLDPLNKDLLNCDTTPNCYIYKYCNLGDHYVVVANLENPPSQTYSNRADCPTGGPNRYWISDK